MNIGITLIGQMITFAIFVWFTMRFVWPVLESALEERKKRIVDGLAAAEEGHQILNSALEQVKVELHKAKVRAGEIIDEANKHAQQIITEAKAEAQKERDNIITAGRDMLKHEETQARVSLQSKVADIIVLGAEKLLSRSINSADHQEILDKLSKEMLG